MIYTKSHTNIAIIALGVMGLFVALNFGTRSILSSPGISREEHEVKPVSGKISMQPTDVLDADEKVNETTKQPISVIRTDAQYAADFSDNKVLMGASHNVFIGKVVRQVGDKERGIGPETQFQVAVIDNIKGDLHGTVTVNQQGGYKDGVLYVVGEDGGGSLLQPGSTYLFATRYNEQQDWYTLNSYPAASKLLSSNANAQTASLKTLADNDSRVQQLKAAYPHEILIDADIAHNNTRNSFESVQASKAQ